MGTITAQVQLTEAELKLSRNLLDSMDRFVLDRTAPAHSRRGDAPRQRRGSESHREQDLEYAEVTRS